MDKSLPSFAYLLETDLARKGLSQRELAAKLTEQGEQPLTEQAISSWKSRGKVPSKRMAQLLEILGPDSEVGKAHARGDTPTMVGTSQDETVYPVRKQIFKPQPYTPGDENPLAPEEHRLPKTQFSKDLSPEEIEASLGAHLRPDLRQFLDVPMTIGNRRLRYDYVSPKVVAEISVAPHQSLNMLPPRFYRKLYRIAMMQRQDADRPRVYGLIVIGDPHHARHRVEANHMGIELAIVPTAREAAQKIEEWEKTPPEDLFSS